MESKEKTIKLLRRAEGGINAAKDAIDEKELFHISGELDAINSIIGNILGENKDNKKEE